MKKIPFAKPYITREEEKAVVNVLRSGWLIQGKQVHDFEEKAKTFLGCNYAVASSSGTSALHMACLLAGIQKGDEVIVPAYTFVATVNAILYAGARPVFVDIDGRTFNLDASRLEKCITSRTKAIMAVHQFGLPAEMDAIYALARKHKLKVIEDAACAFGSEYKGSKIGSRGRYVCFSFHPRKFVTTGEGGLFCTDSHETAEKARRLRYHGASFNSSRKKSPAALFYEKYTEVGYNYRMSNIHAAIGLMQLKKINFMFKRRNQLAKRYVYFFQKHGGDILPPYVPVHCTHNYQSFAVLLPERLRLHRDKILLKMENMGISCRRGIHPVYSEPYYRNIFGSVHLPVTESVYRRTILLPIYTELKKSDQLDVLEGFMKCVKDVQRENKKRSLRK